MSFKSIFEIWFSINSECQSPTHSSREGGHSLFSKQFQSAFSNLQKEQHNQIIKIEYQLLKHLKGLSEKHEMYNIFHFTAHFNPTLQPRYFHAYFRV